MSPNQQRDAQSSYSQLRGAYDQFVRKGLDPMEASAKAMQGLSNDSYLSGVSGSRLKEEANMMLLRKKLIPKPRNPVAIARADMAMEIPLGEDAPARMLKYADNVGTYFKSLRGN